MKKVISMVLVLGLSVCLSVPALALENQNESTAKAEVVDGDIVITVSTQEEADQVVAQIRADNVRAQQLWEEAQKRAKVLDNLERTYVDSYASTTTYVTSVEALRQFGLRFITLTFEALYTKTTNVAGATVFGSVKSISAYAKNSADNVTVLSKNYTLTDSARTIAANYSLRVKVYNSSDGTSNTYSQQYYVEFYISGRGRVY